MLTRSPRDADSRLGDEDISSAAGALLPLLMSLLALVLMLGAGLLLALLFPDVGAGLSAAILGEKSFWYLTRASAFAAYGLLWWSMALGLAISNRMARAWPGGPTVSDLHEYASMLGLAFGLVHALSLLGDRYIGYSLAQVLIPFANPAYRPFWVGLGQLAFYLLIPVTFTFYIRRLIGGRAWRAIHMASFGLFALALAHGIFSGSDSGAAWAQWAYAASGLSIVALTAYRVQVSGRKGRRAAAR